jgi:hypothetical protein
MVYGRAVFNHSSMKYSEGVVERVSLAQNREKWRVLVKTIIKELGKYQKYTTRVQVYSKT